ncbi:MAG: hypothetical protein R2867_04535 [Caldilineaceae bacterium]
MSIISPTPRADLLRRMGQRQEVIGAYEQALTLTEQKAQRDFILYRINSL